MIEENEREFAELLKQIVEEEEVSVYDLSTLYGKKRQLSPDDSLDQVTRIVSALSGRGLVTLSVSEGDDGAETSIRPTDIAKLWLKTHELMR